MIKAIYAVLIDYNGMICETCECLKLENNNCSLKNHKHKYS